jgi:hypothetical protein
MKLTANEKRKLFYLKNPEKKIERNKKNLEWKKKNKDKVNAMSKTWRLKYPEKEKAKNAKYRRLNLEKAKLENAKWYKENAEKSRAKTNKRRVLKLSNGSHTIFEWETLKAQYNWTCPCCKKQEPFMGKYKYLTEDHIIPLTKGGSDNIENIQPLCLSCNSRKNTKIIKFDILNII